MERFGTMGLHMPELIIVLVVAMLIFGPKKLPEMGSAIGRSLKAFRKGMHEISDPDDSKVPELTPKDAPPDSDKDVDSRTRTSSPRAETNAEKQAD